MSFENILGNTETIKQLDSLINSHRLPHAVVIESKDTINSKILAKEISKACVCTNTNHRPCCRCSSCIKAENDNHPDIYTVKITDKRQSLGVGEIRSMISDCYIKPNEASCKVYLIFDKMTNEAQNALLKILEEPPPNVQFIITAESSVALLKTVLSRSTIFTLDNADNNEKAHEIAEEIAAAIPQNIELPLLIATGKLVNDKALTMKTLEILMGFLSLALEEKYFKTEKYSPCIEELSKSLRKRSLVKLIDTVSQAQTMLSQNCNMNLLVTWLCAKIRISRRIA